MSTLTKAAVLFKTNQPLKIININLPDPKKGEVLVKVHFSGICHTQLLETQGKGAGGSFVPNLMGHEGAGIVLKVGKGVKKVKEGDFVVLSWIKGRGLNVLPSPIKYKNFKINRGPITTFSQHTVVSENRVFPISKKIPFNVSSLLGCAVPTGMGMVFNNAKLKKNSSIAIIGCGGIGINAIHASKIAGAKTIIAIDSNKSKKKYALLFGATHFINSNNNNLIKNIEKVTKNELDYAIDTVGQKATMELAYHITNKFTGKTILCGVPNPLNLQISINPFPLYYGKKLVGTGGGETIPDKDLKKYANMYLNKKLLLDKMISNVISLNDINLGFELMKKGKCLRVLIDLTL